MKCKKKNEESGLEWLGVAWSGLEWLGVALSGLEWLGVAWSGLEWLGVAWSGLEGLGVAWNGLEWLERVQGRSGMEGCRDGVVWKGAGMELIGRKSRNELKKEESWSRVMRRRSI